LQEPRVVGLVFLSETSGATMDRAKKVSPLSRPASKANAAPKEQVNFEKAQGSSRHDEADLRDVARKAAKRSKERKGT
jgi:hypothetical protein